MQGTLILHLQTILKLRPPLYWDRILTILPCISIQ